MNYFSISFLLHSSSLSPSDFKGRRGMSRTFNYIVSSSFMFLELALLCFDKVSIFRSLFESFALCLLLFTFRLYQCFRILLLAFIFFREIVLAFESSFVSLLLIDDAFGFGELKAGPGSLWVAMPPSTWSKRRHDVGRTKFREEQTELSESFYSENETTISPIKFQSALVKGESPTRNNRDDTNGKVW